MRKLHKATERPEYKRVFKQIKGFFRGDDYKAVTWMLSSNPSLGYLSPIDMIVMGRGKKLEEFVRIALSENYDK